MQNMVPTNRSIRRFHIFCVLTVTAAFLSVPIPVEPAKAEGMTAEPGLPLPPVLFVRDTGVNVYHEDFRVPDGLLAWDVPGYYPPEATLVDLSLDAPSYQEALDADVDVWESLEFDRLYAFNGTRIVGAIDFGNPHVTIPYPILDLDGHGTLVASAAIGAAWGTCPECRLALATPSPDPELEWAAARDWIDAASYSQGSFLGVANPLTDIESQGAKWAASGRSFFTAAGNGGGDGFFVNHFDDFAGPPWVMRVGKGVDPATWGHRPFEIVATELKPVATHDSMDAFRDGRGTSVASPDAAGHYLTLVWEVRARFGDLDGRDEGHLARAADGASLPGRGPLADGILTAAELERTIMLTAHDIPDHLLAGSWPEEMAYYRQGYGMVDEVSLDLARAVLAGEQDAPDKPWEDHWRSYDQYVRNAWGGTLARCLNEYADVPTGPVACLQDSGWSPTEGTPDVLWPWTG